MSTRDKSEWLSAVERKALQQFATQVRKILGDNLVSIILFGSRARGASTPESDMDVLLVLKRLGGRRLTIACTLSDTILDILLEYGLLISVVPVDLREYTKQDRRLFRDAEREGIVVL